MYKNNHNCTKTENKNSLIVTIGPNNKRVLITIISLTNLVVFRGTSH